MNFVIRDKPYLDKYFNKNDSIPQQMVDSIMSELQDTGSLTDKGCWLSIEVLNLIVDALNASDKFNKYYTMSLREVTDFLGTRFCLVFTKII